MSQNAKLLTWLETHDGITVFEGTLNLGICRLSERVRELEALGYTFDRLRETTPNGAHVTRYKLAGYPARRCSAAEYKAMRG